MSRLFSVALFAAVIARAAAVGVAVTTFASAASAAPLHFRFTLTAPLVYGSETIGGPADPIFVDAVIDSAAPDVSGGGSVGASYIGSSGLTTVGPVSVPTINPLATIIDDTVDIFTVDVGGDGVTQIAGRILQSAVFSLLDFDGLMFTDKSLPTDAAFFPQADSGIMTMAFWPLPTDPEYGTGLVKFIRFFSASASDLALVPAATVSEPPIAAVLAASLIGIAAALRRRW